jgi:3-hydroxypropanoate dehydrogenase
MDEQMRAIYDLVKYGRTAFNQSALRIVPVRRPEARERLPAHT